MSRYPFCLTTHISCRRRQPQSSRDGISSDMLWAAATAHFRPPGPRLVVPRYSTQTKCHAAWKVGGRLFFKHNAIWRDWIPAIVVCLPARPARALFAESSRAHSLRHRVLESRPCPVSGMRDCKSNAIYFSVTCLPPAPAVSCFLGPRAHSSALCLGFWPPIFPCCLFTP